MRSAAAKLRDEAPAPEPVAIIPRARTPFGAQIYLGARLFFVEALRALARHTLRTALTAIGIMVGVAAVIWVVAIGRAGTERAEEELHKLGDNLVWVEAGSRNINGVRNGNKGTNTLTPEDAEAIRREMPLIKAVAENVDGSTQVQAGNKNWNTRWRGVSPEYLEIKRWQMAEGTFFSHESVAHVDSVVVLGETVRKQLFASGPAVGNTVRMHGFLFEVVGVLAPKGQTAEGRDQDDTLMVPWTSGQKKLLGKDYTYLDDILCSAVSPEQVNAAVDAVQALMRQRHHMQPGQDDDFNIRRPDEIIKAQIAASRTLSLLLISLASIALLVGGIGIMNVMLASVAQRTQEIGLRIAVGATQWAVRLQFLGEAVMLSLFGGILGLVLSVGGGFLIEDLLGWKLPLPLEAALLAVVFSVAVGVAFGLYPAWRAARLDPITALRNE
jgi:putative ABC transport system permease protein